MADNQQDVKGIGDRGTGERLKFLRDSSGRIVSDEGHSRLGTFRDGEFQGFVDRVQLDPVEITPTPKPRPPVTKVRKPQATKEAVRSTTPVDRGLETKEAIPQPPRQRTSKVDSGTVGDEILSIAAAAAPFVNGLRSTLATAKARALAGRFRKGEPVSIEDVKHAAKELSDAAQLFGTDVTTADWTPLMDVYAKQIEEQARLVIEQGTGAAPAVVLSLMVELLSIERQKQLGGFESAEGIPQIVLELAKIRASQLEKD